MRGRQRFLIARLVPFDERDSDKPRSRLNRYSKFRRPIRSAAPSASAAPTFSPIGDQLHPFAIDGDLDLMRIARCAGNVNFEVIVRVEREVAANCQSAARSE